MDTTTPRASPLPAEFSEAKRRLTALHAVLGTAYWLTALGGRASVTTRDVRAVYPRPTPPRVPRVSAPSEALVRCVRADRLERDAPRERVNPGEGDLNRSTHHAWLELAARPAATPGSARPASASRASRAGAR
jgi:hypothetical protein